jgi:hypothetical protein
MGRRFGLNGGMTAVLVVGAIAVVGAVVARVTWRRPADERHSIQSHQHTLETLRAMADRRPEPSSGTPTATAPPSVSAPRARVGPEHARSTSRRPATVRAPVAPLVATTNGRGHGELVFDDNGAAPPALADDGGRRPPALAMSKGLARADRGHRRTGRRRSRSGLVSWAVGAVALAVVVAVAVALAPSHHRSAAPPVTATTSPPRTTHPNTTVTTVTQVSPTSASSVAADYTTPTGNYTVALQASGLCWVEATMASTGAVVWTGTLQSGQAHSIPATGSLIVRLGAPNDVDVTLNGTSVLLPSGFASPFDLRFQTT